ncbi:MAG TPA: hypothetical protein VFA12_18475 [Stellaceae bacterium]|nr:hypothetical protein [Stellaceae bacterium]
MSTLTPVGGGHLAVGAGPETTGPVQSTGSPPADPAPVAAAASAPAAHGVDEAYINPRVEIDPLSGVVMLQYRGDDGKIVRQVPSEYELRSYQLGEENAKISGS